MITEKNNVFYCDCGFSFERGRSGAHDCGAGLRKKLIESERYGRQTDITIDNLEMQLNAEREAKMALAAENAGMKDFVKTCFRAAADGASLDGADIQELGERLGLFGRETYQPALHGYICGHEAGEDTVYVIKRTPATDAFLAEVRAQSVEMFAASLGSPYVERGEECYQDGYTHAIERIKCHKAPEFAAQLRKGAAL